MNPVGKNAKVETGLRTSFRDMINDYIVTEKQPNGLFAVMPGFLNKFIYKENITAAYAIFGDKINKFSYQLGIRGEVTDIQTELERTAEKIPVITQTCFQACILPIPYHLRNHSN